MANTCLAAYYDPDLDPETKAGVREAFVRALCDKPLWAVTRAFDAWIRSMQRRPSPGEIVMLAERELKPMTDELRRRAIAASEEEVWRREEQRRVPTADEARRIAEMAGFTPQRMAAVTRAPLARTMDEATRIAETPPPRHWSENADPNGPEMAALRASRAANPILREMAEHSARQNQSKTEE